MNFIFLSLLIGCMPFCNKKVQLELIKAEYQMIAGGTVWSSTEIRYDVYFKTNVASSKLKFEELWIDDMYFKGNEIHVINLANNSNQFEKGDNIKISFSKININRPPEHSDSDLKEQQIEEIKSKPFEFEGQALIAYSFKNKIHYFIVKNFEQMKPVLRP